MSSDLPRLATFLGFAICAFYGGAFIYSLLRSRLLQKKSWITSIGVSILWMILYALFSTVISDLCVAGLRSHSNLVIGIAIFVFLLPYIGIIHVLIKYRKTEQGAAANP
jgi:hypothetical protein